MKNTLFWEISKRFFLVIILLASINLLLSELVYIGSDLNDIVIFANGGRMPVYITNPYLDVANDTTHFCFSSFEQVNLPLLADILTVNLPNSSLRMSFGDLMIFESIFLEFFISVVLISFFVYCSIKQILGGKNGRRPGRRL